MGMREEFEAWAVADADTQGVAIDCVRIGEWYSDEWVNTAWVAWQASRAGLVVELPDNVANTGTLTSNAVLAYKRECCEAIEAAGVKVKS